MVVCFRAVFDEHKVLDSIWLARRIFVLRVFLAMFWGIKWNVDLSSVFLVCFFFLCCTLLKCFSNYVYLLDACFDMLI